MESSTKVKLNLTLRGLRGVSTVTLFLGGVEEWAEVQFFSTQTASQLVGMLFSYCALTSGCSEFFKKLVL